jgi:NADP-dependent 3-hydroxy acid dehydrogenase YdfG
MIGGTKLAKDMESLALDQKIAMVTGASGGIGGAIANHLSGHGATVILVGRNVDKLQHVAATLSGDCVAIRADLTQESEILSLVDTVEARFGRLDILVHCAGAIWHEKLTTAPAEMLDMQYVSNVRGPYVLTQRLLEALARPRGQIVFINSSTGLQPSSIAGQFSMTQHAFKAMADVLRDNINELGIRVMSVYPGRTATPRIEALSGEHSLDYRPELLLQPEDIASVVVNALELPWTAEVTDIRIRPMVKSPSMS